MIIYKTAKKYLGEYVIWERTDKATQFKELIVGGLFRVEEATVVGEKVTYLYIKVGITDELVKWNAAESRVIHERRRRILREDDEDDEEDDDDEEDE